MLLNKQSKVAWPDENTIFPEPMALATGYAQRCDLNAHATPSPRFARPSQREGNVTFPLETSA